LQAKIDPRIFAELSGQIVPTHLGGQSPHSAPTGSPDKSAKPLAQTRFIVYLTTQTNLTALNASQFASLNERRTAVVSALETTANSAQAPIKALLNARMAANNVSSYQPYYVANALAVEGNADTVVELAMRDDVARIVANYPLVMFDQPTAAPSNPPNGLGGLSPANYNVDLVDADLVWSALGITGTGAVVGGIDTGVRWTHVALKDKYRGWDGFTANHNYNWFSPDGVLYANGDLGASITTQPFDYGDHGTHTMGTMVGDGGTADTKIGMAPGAKWVAISLNGLSVAGTYADDIMALKAFQWMLCPTNLTGAFATRDCSQAPDVINNSWGSSSPVDDGFRAAIQALRAAGVVPVFAAGNPSAGPGSIGSPGSIPEAVTVGATTISDTVAAFSARGPSFYEGERKPELSAPGVNVKSSIASSGDFYYANYSGTSMAAPATAGVIALMVSADRKVNGVRDLSSDEIEAFLEASAVDLGLPGPDDDYGYGRIDALAAVRWVLGAGDLRGTVRDATTAAPIPYARVAGAHTSYNQTFTTTTATTGQYSVTVPGGQYNLTVSAFGYVTRSFTGIGVITGTSSIVNLNLTALPTATLTGQVLSGTTPIANALLAVASAPHISTTADVNGFYTLTLPVGAFTLTVKASAYRIKPQAVTVAPSGSTQNITMTPAPTILLVEAERYRGWFYSRAPHNFFAYALNQQNYLYDTAIITNSSILPTALVTPSAHAVVIWAHTGSTPNAVPGFVTLLQNYMDAGGRLIISGQDVASAGGGTFLSSYLNATLATGFAGGEGTTVSGLDFLNGLNLTLNSAALYGYANTATYLAPDAVTPADSDAYPILTYNNGTGAAALAISSCSAPHRAIYFAVGYENLGPRAYNRPPAFDQMLDRSIQWVASNKPSYGVSVSINPTQKTTPPGSVSAYALTIVNTGVNTDTYNLSLNATAWATTIYSGSTIVSQTLALSPCGQQTLQVRVTVPDNASAGASDAFTVTTQSQTNALVESVASATTTAFPNWQIETPMPTARYRLATTDLPGSSYYYALGGGTASYVTTVNERYDACANRWTTMAPLPAARSNFNAAVLNGTIHTVGGYNGSVSVNDHYVYSPTANLWITAAVLPMSLSGVAIATVNGKLYAIGGSDNLGNFVNATYEYDPATNTWTNKAPMPTSRGYAVAAASGNKIYVVGGWLNLNVVEVYDPVNNSWTTAAPMNIGRQSPGLAVGSDGYLYVSGGGNGWTGLNSAERYNPTTNVWTLISTLNDSNRAGSGSAFVAGRVFAIGGYGGIFSNANESLKLSSTFCASTKTATPITVQPGERITYTITLVSNSTATNASVTDPLPVTTTFAGFGPSTVSPAPTYNVGLNRVEWSGTLPANQPPVTFTFSVLVNAAGWADGQLITNTATFDDGAGLSFTRTAATRIALFDLSTSTKSVNQTVASAGDVLTYTIRLAETAGLNGLVVLNDPIPTHTTYIPGSVTATAGTAGFANGVVTWTLTLPPPPLLTYTNNSGAYQLADNPFTTGTTELSPLALLQWEDTTGATTIYNGYVDDATFGPFPIGFNFPWFGSTRSQFYLDSNGRVRFAAGGFTDYSYCSTVNDAISFFGGDRATATDGIMRYKQFSDRTVIELLHIGTYGSSTTAYMDIQVILYNSGMVKVQYRNLVGTFSGGVQLRSPTGAMVVYGCPATLNTARGVVFLPDGVTEQLNLLTTALSFAVTTTTNLSVSTHVTNTAVFTDNHGGVYTRSVSTLLNIFDASNSTKSVNRATALAGNVLTYTIRVTDTAMRNGSVILNDPIPVNTTYISGSVTATAGTAGFANGVVTWTLIMPPPPLTYTNNSGAYQLADNPFITGTTELSPLALLQWEDTTGATTIYNGYVDDAIFGPFPIGFNFPWFGTTRSQFYLDSNGRVRFAAGGFTDYSFCSTLNDTLSFFGGNRATAADGIMRYKQFSNRTVIELLHIGSYGSSFTTYMDIQVILYNSGMVKVQYRNLVGTFSGGVQLRSPTGATVVYGCPATVNTARGVVFLPDGVTEQLNPFTAALSFAVTTTTNLSVSTSVTNTAIFTDNHGGVYTRSTTTLLNVTDLSASTKSVNPAQGVPGMRVSYAIVLRNTGPFTASGISLSDPIPSYMLWDGNAPTCVSGSCTHSNGLITWIGDVPPAKPVTVTFGVTYTGGLPDFALITNTATITAGQGVTLVRRASFVAGTTSLSQSYKTVSSVNPKAGDIVTYTLYARNIGGLDTVAQLSDALPAGVTYVTGSLAYGDGVGGYANGVITWTGSVIAFSQVPIQFQVLLDSGLATWQRITNTAVISDLLNNTSQSFSVTFIVNVQPLTVNVNGGGVATSQPSGIHCGVTCATYFTPGTVVTLTATPNAGFTFGGWSGDCAGTGLCVVTMTTARNVTATFPAITRPLTVNVTGGGVVTSQPSGINCGVTCVAYFTQGTVVTLTATPFFSFVFNGWSGDCAGTGLCVVTMANARNVTATFTSAYVPLNVTVSGGGVVTSQPSGINCGVTCVAYFTQGTVVTLTATPNTGFTLGSWSSDCAGTGLCVVTMTTARNVAATFTLANFPVYLPLIIR
jgi:uncharacterized repeat protein (TIGR01451 family)